MAKKETEVLSIRMPKEIYDAIEDYARAEGITRNAWGFRMLSAIVESMQADKEMLFLSKPLAAQLKAAAESRQMDVESVLTLCMPHILMTPAPKTGTGPTDASADGTAVEPVPPRSAEPREEWRKAKEAHYVSPSERVLYPPLDFMPVRYTEGRPTVYRKPLPAMAALEVWHDEHIVWVNVLPPDDDAEPDWIMHFPGTQETARLWPGKMVRTPQRDKLYPSTVFFAGGKPYLHPDMPLEGRYLLVQPPTGSHFIVGKVVQNGLGRWLIHMGGHRTIPLQEDMTVFFPKSGQ